MKRRTFVKSLVGSSALSFYSLNKLNASVYENLEILNKDFPQQDSPDGVYWQALRKHFIFQDDIIMMNNGTVGPMPEPVYNMLMHCFKIQATNPFECYDFMPRKKEEVRRKLADFINASTDEVVINRNTTEGMNTVAHGLDLKEGDEVIISSQEHPAGTHPWKLRAKRHGIKIVEAKLGAPPKNVKEIIDAFEKAITPRTKVISVSHTVFITGLIFPMKEVSELAHKKGIFVFADSAHGLGMLDLNMKELGMDVFCSSPYKWFGAPTGCGVMYVKKEVQDQIYPLIASSGWDTNKNAQRFETLSQRADPIIIALGEAIDFQSRIGKPRIERRIKSLAGYLKKGLKTIPKVRLHTPEDSYISGGLTAFSIENVEPQYIVDYLREKYNIVIRTIGRDADKTRGVRASTHIYISKKHVDLALEGINYLAKKA